MIDSKSEFPVYCGDARKNIIPVDFLIDMMVKIRDSDDKFDKNSRGFGSAKSCLPRHSQTSEFLAPPSPTFLNYFLSLNSEFSPQICNFTLKSPPPHLFEVSSSGNLEEILKYLRTTL